jgi:hypothetical protein
MANEMASSRVGINRPAYLNIRQELQEIKKSGIFKSLADKNVIYTPKNYLWPTSGSSWPSLP